MSSFDYNEFAFSSDDENLQIDYENDEDDLVEDPNHHSNKDEPEHHLTEIDEYAIFETDEEKYRHDQQQWNGMPNPRKYTIRSKPAKGKGEAGSQRQAENKKKDKAQDVKPRKKRTSKKEASPDESVAIPEEGEISFDGIGNLWYTHKKDNIFLSERATFHHWIRPVLCQIENAKGTYDFPRKRGAGNYDITCFNEVQKHWGLERAHYAPIMFLWERLGRKDPDYPLESLYYEGLLVIDYWHTPVRNFREIPLVISSVFEGGFIEPSTRLHSEIAYEDLRARMPPYVETRNKDQVIIKPLSKASTLSGRARHFREDAGAISFDKREGSANIKSYIENIVKPVGNSTLGARDLTKDEVKRLRLLNHGSHPGRAKPGITKESKEKYIAKIRKAAGANTAAIFPQQTNNTTANIQEHEAEAEELIMAEDSEQQKSQDSGWKVDYAYYFNDLDDDRFVENPLAYEKDIEKPEENLTSAEGKASPTRFLFICAGSPALQAMTEQEALTNPDVNWPDPRNHIPKFTSEVEAIRDALQVTIDHFKEIFGLEPEVTDGANYVTEYCNIQEQMDDLIGDDATALRRLGRWEGLVYDWEKALIEDEPCVGRRTDFMFLSTRV